MSPRNPIFVTFHGGGSGRPVPSSGSAHVSHCGATNAKVNLHNCVVLHKASLLSNTKQCVEKDSGNTIFSSPLIIST